MEHPQNLDHRKYIIIKNASQNNLKNIDLAIPQNKFIVFTGVSGSGKSSLAFDTLYAEGQRRYIESLSSYIRQFLGKIEKPAVDYIKGLAPAVAIQQKVNTSNPRSTVGTTTEIYDYLKLLFARAGKIFAPETGNEVKRHTVTDIIDYFKKLPENSKARILSPIEKHAHRDWIEEFSVMLQKGFTRVVIENKTIKAEEIISFLKDESKNENIQNLNITSSVIKNPYLLIDRVIAKNDEENLSRIADSAQTAFFEGHGTCVIEVSEDEGQTKRKVFSNKLEEDGMEFLEPSINLFTFNSPYGACKRCEGFGQTIGIDEDKVIPDKTLSVFEDAIACWKGEKMSEWKHHFISTSQHYDFPIHRPYNQLNDEQKDLLWNGKGAVKGINHFFRYLESKAYKIQYRVLTARYKGKTTCPECRGKRLRKEATYIKIDGKSIIDLVDLQISELYEFLRNLKLSKLDAAIAERIIEEILKRTEFLMDVGLSYLTINRPSNTLSGGESQRIQLVTTLGSNLTGALYILDEPSIGLHSRDNQRLIKVLKKLKGLGNTVIVVEHDEEIIKAADEIVDIGPFAGSEGGKIIFQGNQEELLRDRMSLTSKYLNGSLEIDKKERRKNAKNFIKIEGAFKHNLKSIDVTIPLKALTVVTGVSGSGKSTLVKEVLFPSLNKSSDKQTFDPKNCHRIEVPVSNLNVEYVDQNPIGRSSRSNPVTYIKAFDGIRELFAAQPASRIHGYSPAHFSFNVEGGRCETCKGEGFITVEMQFMADIHLVCDACKGKRYKDDVLKILFKEKNISDVLEMTVKEAMEFFENEKSISNQLKPLQDVGLDYLKLGQPSTNLSGGEAQRIKLASFLTKSSSQDPVLFIFDEPTTGLHFHDIDKLLESFNALIENGHTVVVVEHNLDVIKNADWIIDLGKEGGKEGGNLIFQGKPEKIINEKESITGKFLKNKFKNHFKIN